MSGFFLVLVECAVFFIGATLVGLGFGYALERAAWKRGRKVFEVPPKRGQLRTEILGTVLFLVVWVPIIAAVAWSETLHFTTGWLAALLTWAGCWYGFQILYYGLHRAMHLRPLFWMHRWHHESLVTSPMTGLSMSPAETLGWVACFLLPIYALSAAGVLHETTLLVFFAFHFIGNVAGHANAEIFPQRVTRLSSMLWSNPISYHSLHHARFDGHYSFAAAPMDVLFGTEWPDWKEIHDRVMDGKPLTSLREKGPSFKHAKAEAPTA